MRWGDEDDDARHGPNTVPANKLTQTERRQIIALATSAEFRDQSPKQIVPRLADQGRYLASEATFYRVLHAADMQHHRHGGSVRHSARWAGGCAGSNSPGCATRPRFQ